MISYVGHKEPGRVILNAVLDDISPLEHGTEFEYWRGETDFDPTGTRRDAFNAASRLEALGRVALYQRRNGDGDYSYIGKVVR